MERSGNTGARRELGSPHEYDEREAGCEGYAVNCEQDGSQARNPWRARGSAPKLSRDSESANGNDRRSDENPQAEILAEDRQTACGEPERARRKCQRPVPPSAGKMPGSLPGDTEGEEAERIGDVDREKARKPISGRRRTPRPPRKGRMRSSTCRTPARSGSAAMSAQAGRREPCKQREARSPKFQRLVPRPAPHPKQAGYNPQVAENNR